MERDEIQHFSHPEHPLVLRYADHNNELNRCKICQLGCSRYFYACKKCTNNFVIHESCAKLLPQINHPFHPQHPLSLSVKAPNNSKPFDCNACGNFSWGSIYHCPLCQFVLDTNCATLMPKTTIQSNYESHPHTLFLCNAENDPTSCYYCWCGVAIEKDSIYVCLECRNLLCLSCVKLPFEMKHPFHPDHTLALFKSPPSGSRSFRCSACNKKRKGLLFHCVECGFDLDTNCSFLMPIDVANGDDVNNSQQYVSHPHPLFLCENKKKLRIFCACQKPFEDDSISIFWCLTCRHLLHKSCAELPLEMKHIFHPNHPLSLRHFSSKTFDCNSCMQQGIIGFAYTCYHCENCNFCTRCALKTSHTINSALHTHPLAFVSQIYSHHSYLKSAKPLCTLCDFYCAPNWLRCVPCNINFHFQCIPTLPQKVSYRFHRHAFTLNKSPIKDREDEDENSEFLCDICEKERRLYDPTYYCAECHYVAHIHCLIPEIVRLMEEEWSLTHKPGDTNEVASRALEGPEIQIAEVTEQYSLTETKKLDESDKLSIDKSEQYSLKEAMEPEEYDKFNELHAKARVKEAELLGLTTRLEAFEKRRAQLLGL